MAADLSKKGRLNTLFLIIAISTALCLLLTFVYAEPVGPSISVLGNTTKVLAQGSIVNSTNGTNSPGGFIFTLSMNSEQQNRRWKAYVGNVTGKLVLDDADGNSIFQWTLSTVTGEVYASRASTINWTGINCTWTADGKANRTEGLSSNRTPENDENLYLNQIYLDDNITTTFRYTNHTSMQIGSRLFGKDECYSVQTWQRNAEQTFEDSDNANFTQVILYDGAFNTTGGNVVYETKIENNIAGYDSSETYDFQMILPEDGRPTWTSSTAYYFYVELT